MRRLPLLLLVALLLVVPAAVASSAAREGRATATGRFVFAASREKLGQTDIYSAHADGTDVRRLTRTSVSEGALTASRTGSRIAFIANGVGLGVMNGDGSGYRIVDRFPSEIPDGGYDTDPALSPDGTRLAFVSAREGLPAIYVVNAGGTRLRRLSHEVSPGETRAWSPTWSRDGSKLLVAVAAAPDQDYTERFALISARDGHVIRRIRVDLPGLLTAGGTKAIWSPDNKRIAFDACQGRGCMFTPVLIANADGTHVRRLRFEPRAETAVGKNWSPDSRSLLYGLGFGFCINRLFIATGQRKCISMRSAHLLPWEVVGLKR